MKRAATSSLPSTRWIAVGVCIVLASGVARPSLAAPETSTDAPAAVPSQTPAKVASDDTVAYRIVPGDLIEVKSLIDGNLNETVRVGPDGKIVHPLTGYFRAEGLTPEELAQSLNRELARTVRDPNVTVFVREYAGRVVYVGGEVFHPHDVPILGKMSAMSAILAAGGFTPAGDLSKVVLLRRGDDGTATSRVVDLARLAEGESGVVDPSLAPFDIVIVPPTTITEVDRFVEQYITRVIPGNLSAGFTYVLGHQTITP